jgi:hypothetical protein
MGTHPVVPPSDRRLNGAHPLYHTRPRCSCQAVEIKRIHGQRAPDHEGSWSTDPEVRFRTLPVTVSRMSIAEPLRPVDANTRCLPSGAQLGSSLLPRDVSTRRSEPSGDTVTTWKELSIHA